MTPTSTERELSSGLCAATLAVLSLTYLPMRGGWVLDRLLFSGGCHPAGDPGARSGTDVGAKSQCRPVDRHWLNQFHRHAFGACDLVVPWWVEGAAWGALNCC